jgi:phage terminase small subunit
MKLTIKQEKFCNLYIELGNASEAYRQSYNCEKMKPESVNIKAFELLNNGKITLRIEELRSELAERHDITKDTLINELEEARQIAKETAKAASMVSATMGKARILGLDKQVIEHTGTNGTPLQLPTFNIVGVVPKNES